MRYLPTNLISQVAEKQNIDPFLIAAVVWKESRGDTYACRYEPNYSKDWLVDIHTNAKNMKISRETEMIHQKTSWGLMQVMGGTARWLGFDKQIPKLTLPNVGLEYGAKYLKYQLKRYNNNTTDALAAYNRGFVDRNEETGKYVNQNYVDDVMGYFKELTK